MSQTIYQITAQRIPGSSRIIVEKHRHIRYCISNCFEVLVQLFFGRFDKHRLQNADGICSDFFCHLGDTNAFLCSNATDSHEYRHTSLCLIYHDLQCTFHLILFYHVELTVTSECKYTDYSAVDNKIYLLTKFCLINFLIFVYRGQNRYYNTALHKICVHTCSPFIFF